MTKKENEMRNLFWNYICGNGKTWTELRKKLRNKDTNRFLYLELAFEYETLKKLQSFEGYSDDRKLFYNISFRYFEAVVESIKIKNTILHIGASNILTEKIKEIEEFIQSLKDRKMW